MAGKIHRFDAYGLRKWKPYDVKTFVDIGANVGTTSIMARILFPEARILAFEPCRENFEKLLFFKRWFIECYNIALGDGAELSFHRSSHSGMHRFLSPDDPHADPAEYKVSSKTLPMILADYRVESPYILKIDCEGGERFLLNDSLSMGVVRESLQTNLELHRKHGGRTAAWQQWIAAIDTHQLFVREGRNGAYIYMPAATLPDMHRIEIELLRTDQLERAGQWNHYVLSHSHVD